MIFIQLIYMDYFFHIIKAQALALMGGNNPAFKADNVDRFKESLSAEQKRHLCSFPQCQTCQRWHVCKYRI
ncbi:hypothetical protein DJ539_02040 [Enterobacter hormaechei]|nr:hypothetical protein DJ539_02040 [Enterobacter hormaechei]